MLLKRVYDKTNCMGIILPARLHGVRGVMQTFGLASTSTCCWAISTVFVTRQRVSVTITTATDTVLHPGDMMVRCNAVEN
jgi:hypothetical protein